MGSRRRASVPVGMRSDRFDARSDLPLRPRALPNPLGARRELLGQLLGQRLGQRMHHSASARPEICWAVTETGQGRPADQALTSRSDRASAPRHPGAAEDRRVHYLARPQRASRRGSQLRGGVAMACLRCPHRPNPVMAVKVSALRAPDPALRCSCPQQRRALVLTAAPSVRSAPCQPLDATCRTSPTLCSVAPKSTLPRSGSVAHIPTGNAVHDR